MEADGFGHILAYRYHAHINKLLGVVLTETVATYTDLGNLCRRRDNSFSENQSLLFSYTTLNNWQARYCTDSEIAMYVLSQ